MVISCVYDSVFIKFADGWKKVFRKFDKFGGRNQSSLTGRPIDLKYVSGNGQSISSDKNVCLKKLDFLYE